jgi:hypothetical protein
MTIVKRLVKGSELTHAELDGNFTDLDARLLLTASAALSVVAASGASQTVNVASYGVVDITLTSNTTLTVSGADTTKSFALTLVLRQDTTGGRTVTFPSGVRWPGGTAPTLTATASHYDVVRIFTNDGGTTWQGQVLGLNYAAASATILASDTFTRANSTTTPGTADVGGAWSVLTGAWGINTNRATSVTASLSTPAYMVINVGITNVDVTADITSAQPASAACLAVRVAADASSSIICGYEILPGNINLYKVVGGSYTLLASVNAVSIGVPYSTPYTLRVTAVGSVINVYINGTRVTALSADYSAQITGALLTNTRVGFRDDVPGNFYDNFSVVAG